MTSLPSDSSDTHSSGGQGLVVDASEDGLKVISFLERHLELPRNLLHRWIRTGQIRVNGSRTQPFSRVVAGNAVRLPPFAGAMSTQAKTAKANHAAREAAIENVPQKVEVIAEDGPLLAVFKPAGLPTHPGTGHRDSLATRLARVAGTLAFAPTPIHRLDRDTSGVLLVAKTFRCLREMQELFQGHGDLHKEYLAWVDGFWPHKDEITLTHYLTKKQVGDREQMVASTDPSQGAMARLAVRPVMRYESRSLLLVRIFTGRTHQIRVQLATVGHPVLGDPRYGKPAGQGATMYLHAFRIFLPYGRVFQALPRWKGDFAISDIPSPIRTGA